MKILIVDDSRTMRNIHINSLVEFDVKEEDILQSADGMEALDVIGNHNDIGLIMLDWSMPNLDGLSFIKKARAIKGYSKTPIIMITALSQKADVLEAIKAGATDYIIKPITGDILWKKLKPYFKGM